VVTKRSAWILGVAVAAAAGGALGCAGGGGASGDDSGGWDGVDASSATPQCFSSSECPTGWTCSDFHTCEPPPTEGDAAPPVETEYELTEPHSSRRYVWVAMTDQDRLAKIDGASLEVMSVPVGDRPRVLATLPNTDTAVVLDSINGAATVVRPADGSVSAELYATLPHLNRLATTPGGRYAVAFFDLAKAIAEAGSLDAVTEIGSFQDVTVLSVEPGHERAVDLTVGFRPRQVDVDATGEYAFVITDDGVSVLDLATLTAGEPTIVPPIPVTSDPFGDASGVEVKVVSSGEFAIVRTPGEASVRVARLLGPDAGEGWDIPLPREPSDIDLAPDGTRVYATMKDPAGLAVIDVPADAFDPSGVRLVNLAGATGGQLELSADGTRGALFTNTVLDERVTIVRLDVPSFPHETFPLQKAVRTVGFDPSGTKLLVLHARAPGDPDDATSFDEYIDRKPGYSIVDIATGFAKLEINAVDPAEFTFALAAPRAYVTLDGGDAEGAVKAFQQIQLDTGVVHTIELGSPPDDIGVLPESNKVFVSQRHPSGRVTFVDVDTDQIQTLTGFDLNSQIID
jgi:DNA-binding beta-propeller fold protein YncE